MVPLVPVFGESYAPTLDHFDCADVYPFMWVDAIFKFRLKNLRILFALVVTRLYIGPSPKCCWLGL